MVIVFILYEYYNLKHKNTKHKTQKRKERLRAKVKKSIKLINTKKIKIINISNIYETPSYPNEKNPKFLNVCLAVHSKEKPDSKSADKKKLKMSLGKSKVEVNPEVEIGVYSGGQKAPNGNLH